MLKWLLFGFVVFLLYRWSLRMPRYTEPVSAEHLMEVSGGLGRILPVAVQYIGKEQPLHPFATGTAFTTSGRVNVFYTIAKSDKGTFEHHISMNSTGKRRLSDGVAGFIAAGIGRILGHVGARGVLAESSVGMFYFIVPFPADEHEKLVDQGITAIDEQTARKMFELAMADRDHLVKNLGKLDVKVPKS